MAQTAQGVPEELRPIVMEAYKQGLISQTKTYKRILDAADIDDTEDFILTVLDPDSNTSQILEALTDRASQGPGAGQTPPQQGPVGQPGGPPPNGAAGPAGIPGGPGPIG